MHISDWGYHKEQDFVRDAMVSSKRRNDLLTFSYSLIEGIAKIYKEKGRYEETVYATLLEIGKNSFDKAFNNYIKLTNAFESKEFLFSTYFAAYLKQAMEHYIKTNLMNS